MKRIAEELTNHKPSKRGHIAEEVDLDQNVEVQQAGAPRADEKAIVPVRDNAIGQLQGNLYNRGAAPKFDPTVISTNVWLTICFKYLWDCDRGSMRCLNKAFYNAIKNIQVNSIWYQYVTREIELEVMCYNLPNALRIQDRLIRDCTINEDTTHQLRENISLLAQAAQDKSYDRSEIQYRIDWVLSNFNITDNIRARLVDNCLSKYDDASVAELALGSIPLKRAYEILTGDFAITGDIELASHFGLKLIQTLTCDVRISAQKAALNSIRNIIVLRSREGRDVSHLIKLLDCANANLAQVETQIILERWRYVLRNLDISDSAKRQLLNIIQDSMQNKIPAAHLDGVVQTLVKLIRSRNISDMIKTRLVAILNVFGVEAHRPLAVTIINEIIQDYVLNHNKTTYDDRVLDVLYEFSSLFDGEAFMEILSRIDNAPELLDRIYTDQSDITQQYMLYWIQVYLTGETEDDNENDFSNFVIADSIEDKMLELYNNNKANFQ